MKILLIGYGKMGKTIEKHALEKRHVIVGTVGNHDQLRHFNLKKADIAIEFTQPDAAYHNIKYCFDHHIPVVSGTTGWEKQRAEISQYCLQKKASFFYASNFSIGVNIFFEINKKLAQLMNNHSSYDVKIQEAHHIHKKDAPSGTAVTLAEDIINNLDRKRTIVSNKGSSLDELEIESIREKEIIGTHQVTYQSFLDTIKISHIAHDRAAFALGALLAAEWLIGKKGVFGMKDFL